MIKKGEVVYVVVYSISDTEDYDNNMIRIKAFESESKAEKYIKKEYEQALKEFEDEDCVNEVISSNIWDNNAEILVGDKEDELVYYAHTWRVHKSTI